MNTKAVIRSQYLAALKMLERGINKCPDDVWDDQQFKNRFWHVTEDGVRFLWNVGTEVT